MSLKDLDFSDSFESSVAPTQGLLSAGSLQVFANDTAFETSKGSAAADGDAYINSTTGLIRFYSTSWQNVVDEDNVQTVVNKAMSDATNNIVDQADATKRLNFELGGATTSTRTTIVSSQTADRSITLPDATDTLVGLATGDTLTNKTIDADNNTISNLAHGAEVDDPSSGVHGVAGSVVGTSDSQVLTNKDIDGGTASNTSRVTLPKAAKATLDGLTRKEATIVYASDEKKGYLDDGTSLVEIGAGAGGGGGILTEYVTNGDAETDTSGWTAYANTSAANKPDDFGGTPSGNFTIARQTSNPARGDAHFEFSKTASDEQGEGFYFDFDLENGDLAEVLRASLEAKVISGTYADGDIRIYLVLSNDGFSSDFEVKEPAPTELASASFWYKQIFEVQTDSARTDARLCVHVASTSASAYVMGMDSISFGKAARVVGAPVSDWVSFTPTGTWTANTTYSGQWRRIGDSVEVEYQLDLAGAPNAANLNLNMPSGISIDTAKLTSTDFRTLLSLDGFAFDSSTTQHHDLIATYTSGASVTIRERSEGDSGGTDDIVSQSVPFTWAASDKLWIKLRAPVAGWSANVALSHDADTRVVAAIVSGDTAVATDGNPLIWPTINADSHAAYNATTGRYTVPVSGWYEVSCVVVSSTNQRQLYVYKDAVTHRLMGTTDGNGEGTFTALVQANAGQILDIRPSGGSFETTSGAANASFKRLSGPATIAASEKISARYNSNAGESLTANVTDIPFSTADYDTHGSWDGSQFTAPSTGRYKISAMWRSTASISPFTYAYVNGTQYALLGVPYAASNFHSVTETEIELNKGDTLSIRSDTAATLSTTNDNVAHWISISKG